MWKVCLSTLCFHSFAGVFYTGPHHNKWEWVYLVITWEQIISAPNELRVHWMFQKSAIYPYLPSHEPKRDAKIMSYWWKRKGRKGGKEREEDEGNRRERRWSGLDLIFSQFDLLWSLAPLKRNEGIYEQYLNCRRTTKSDIWDYPFSDKDGFPWGNRNPWKGAVRIPSVFTKHTGFQGAETELHLWLQVLCLSSSSFSPLR